MFLILFSGSLGTNERENTFIYNIIGTMDIFVCVSVPRKYNMGFDNIAVLNDSVRSLYITGSYSQ